MRSVLILAALILLPPSSGAQTLNPAECPGATKKLSEQLELYEQLGQAFLQSNQTLIDVYSTFAEKLPGASPGENERTAEHFRKSAEDLRRAQAANETVLKNLRDETERLRKQVAWCTGTPAEVRLFVSSVQFVQQTGRSVKVLYRAWLGPCDRPAGVQLIRDESFGYRVQMSATRSNCGLRNDPFLLWESELELGPLESGPQELRFDVSPEGHYYSLSLEVKP